MQAISQTLLALGIAAAPGAVASGSATADQFQDVRLAIQEALVSEELPSISVAVAQRGEIIWEEGFGFADRERLIAATEHTIYSLASISKPITATGLMILVERGVIDLDTPANDYLGEARLCARVGDASEATVRSLANHTSGLASHAQKFYQDEPHRPLPMDQTILRYGNLVTAPGERTRYSNLGFGVLGHVIARVSGTPYAEFMRREVFIPLGMTRTSVGISSGQDHVPAIRYSRDGSPLPFYETDTPAAADCFSTVHDLIRFGMFHLKNHRADQNAILTDAALDRMREPTSFKRAYESYGVAWLLETEPHLPPRFGHGGGMLGVTTNLALFPEDDLAVVVLCNRNTRQVGNLIDMIRDIMIPPPDTPEESQAAQPRPRNRPAPFAPEPGMVGTWAGIVDVDPDAIPLILEVKPDGDIQARLGEGPWTPVKLPRNRDGYFSGNLSGSLGTENSSQIPYQLRLEFKLRGDVLNGSLTTQFSSRHNNRVDALVPHWVELTIEK